MKGLLPERVSDVVILAEEMRRHYKIYIEYDQPTHSTHLWGSIEVILGDLSKVYLPYHDPYIHIDSVEEILFVVGKAINALENINPSYNSPDNMKNKDLIINKLTSYMLQIINNEGSN